MTHQRELAELRRVLELPIIQADKGAKRIIEKEIKRLEGKADAKNNGG